MLVLSRKAEQAIVFPNLGITLEIINVKGNNVRVGIDAPKSVKILRRELLDDEGSDVAQVFDSLQTNLSSLDLKTKHKLRNFLNTASLSINVAQKQFATGGDPEKANKFLSRAVDALNELNQHFQSMNLIAEPISETPAEGIETSPTLQSNNSWTALIVEDNDNERELLAGVLRMSGFDVNVVADGQEAIEYLKENGKPDVVLMDMEMPRLNGTQTISKIRNEMRERDLPIFGVSGLTQAEAAIPNDDRIVTGWFSKPVNPNQLVKHLRQRIVSNCEPSAN